jgi:hypothetical protein
MYSIVCRERFELDHFPFDSQDLSLDLRLNDPKTWDLYNLTVNAVQFNRQALELTEWNVHNPVVKRESPKEKFTKVSLKVERFYSFYIQNIVLMMFSLDLLGLSAFAVEIADVGTRVNILLTLILTTVAFKFVLSGSLPKVSYNTAIDYYIIMAYSSLAMMTVLLVIASIIKDPIKAVYANHFFALLSLCAIIATLIGWLAWSFRIRHKRQTTKGNFLFIYKKDLKNK